MIKQSHTVNLAIRAYNQISKRGEEFLTYRVSTWLLRDPRRSCAAAPYVWLHRKNKEDKAARLEWYHHIRLRRACGQKVQPC